jgi:hypothetical protein
MASPSSSSNSLRFHLVCGAAQYDIVAASKSAAAARVEGTNMVAVIEGIDGVMFDSVPLSRLRSCDTYNHDGSSFLYVAEVLFTRLG